MGRDPDILVVRPKLGFFVGTSEGLGMPGPGEVDSSVTVTSTGAGSSICWTSSGPPAGKLASKLTVSTGSGGRLAGLFPRMPLMPPTRFAGVLSAPLARSAGCRRGDFAAAETARERAS